MNSRLFCHLHKGFNLTDQDLLFNQTSHVFYHRLIESMKHAFSKRTYFGDDRFVNFTNVEFLVIYIYRK